jgi:hypothetical protein
MNHQSRIAGIRARDDDVVFATAHSGEPGAGGADRVRTDDPLVANQVLSQLSYSPYSAQCPERSMRGGPR